MKLIFLLLVFVGCSSWAADWEYSGKSTTGDTFQVDRESITNISGPVWKGWTKAISGGGNPSRKYSSQVSLYEVNCIDKTYRITSSTTYGKADVVTGSTNEPFARFEPVIPDTVSEGLQKTICISYLLSKAFDEWKKKQPSP